MRHTFTWLALFLTGFSCICGMCNKEDHYSIMHSDSTWVKLSSNSDLVDYDQYYRSNPFDTNGLRPYPLHWLPTSIFLVNVFISTNTNKPYLFWQFENTGNTRFFPYKANQGGKEEVTIRLDNFSKDTGQYDMVNDNSYVRFDVFDANGKKRDSTFYTFYRLFQVSTINVSKMTLVKEVNPRLDMYQMSGTAFLSLGDLPNGNRDLVFGCKFNNIPVYFPK